VPVLVEIEDLDPPLEDEEEVDAAIAALEEKGAFGNQLCGTVGGDALHHLVAQVGKGLRLPSHGVARVEVRSRRWIQIGHDEELGAPARARNRVPAAPDTASTGWLTCEGAH
jgi:hypothetical protein